MEFKIAKLLTMDLNAEKFRYANVVPAAVGVTMENKCVEVTITNSLEVSLEAELNMLSSFVTLKLKNTSNI